MAKLPLNLHLLGSFQAILGEEDVTSRLRTEKERALLAYLAVEAGRPLTRERVAELLWPERGEASARTNLRQALLGVRRAIGDHESEHPFLVTTDETIQFSNERSFWLDTTAFNAYFQMVYSHSHKSLETCLPCAQSLQKAVELYRGEYLSGLLLSDSTLFQEWVTIYREQYFRYLSSALQTLSDYFQYVGDFDLALQYARRQVISDPLDENAHRRVMYMLALNGSRAAAIEQYQTCVQTLKRELNVQPSAETLTLFETIRNGEVLPSKISTGTLKQITLPPQYTTFSGRESELESLLASLSDPQQRLITIVGMGGIGKTRLALQAAEKNTSLFPDGVHYVSLENITSADLLIPSIAQAVGLSFRGGVDPQKQLTRFLRPLKMLIVIDTIEHMLDQSPFFMLLLEEALGVTLILTSRRRVSYQAATMLELKGLPYPKDIHDPDARNYPAVKLFIHRASHNQAGFEIEQKDMPYIVRICQVTHGLPLALELAASRVREFSMEQIATELGRGLQVLQTQMFDLPERHRSGQALFAPCWHRLSATDRSIYKRLAVFQDGFDLAATQVIAGASLPLLSAFMDRSLLEGDAAHGFFLHPMLKHFALEKLKEDPQDYERILDLHSQYYLEYLQCSIEDIEHGERPKQLIREVDAQINNIRAAMTHARITHRTESFRQSTDILQHYYEIRNEFRKTKPLDAALVLESAGSQTAPQSYPFKSETRQLLDILIHASISQKETFLRELLANAWDALDRLGFEVLSQRDVVDPQLPLCIRLLPDPDRNTLTISDTGVGMTTAEISESLGTIAQAGARAFVQAVQTGKGEVGSLLDQFGLSFFSIFMVADTIRVESRSFRPQASAVAWSAAGSQSYAIEPIRRSPRGTNVILHLRPEALEFLQPERLSEIIRRHADFIPYPIYLGDSDQQINRRLPLWRQPPDAISWQEYHDLYRQFTLDQQAPATYGALSVDAPANLSALLFIPNRYERGMFSPRREDGLKLYVRQVLMQDYCKDLLPEYFGFVQGIVETDDPLLYTLQQTMESNQALARLKKLLTAKVIDILSKLAKDNPDGYIQFWKEFGRFIKEGVALDAAGSQSLYPLLRFQTIDSTGDWLSLRDYLTAKKPEQQAIYYIVGDDQRSVIYSPHLDVVRQYGYDVLALTDPADAFMLTRLTNYANLPLVNVADADLKMRVPAADLASERQSAHSEQALAKLVERVKMVLGERVVDVRVSDRLSDSPARLVDHQPEASQPVQRVYRLLRTETEIPRKVLELNPDHPIVRHLSSLPDHSTLAAMIAEQIYENALLLEGLHPDPAGMIHRIQKLMEIALAQGQKKT